MIHLVYQFVLEPTYSFPIVTSATEEPDKLKIIIRWVA